MNEAIRRTLEQLGGVRDSLLLSGYENVTPVVRETVLLLTVLDARLQAGLDAPLLVAFLGGTGVGKSTIFNTFIGHAEARTSVIRPCTDRPLLYAHHGDASFIDDHRFLPSPLIELMPEIVPENLRVIRHSDAQLQGIVFIDSPDFDSIDGFNRDIADFLFRRCDLIVFVTSPTRYADEAQWKYLRRAAGMGRPFWIVLNQLTDMEVLQDLQDKMDREEMEADLYHLPYDAGALECFMITDPNGTIASLKEGLLRQATIKEKNALHVQEVVDGFISFQKTILQHLGPYLREERRVIGAMRRSLEEFHLEERDRLIGRLRQVIGDETRDKINHLFRENIKAYADPLRYVRRTITAPLNYLGEATRTLFGKRVPGENRGEVADQVLDKHHGFNQDLVWSSLNRLQGNFIAMTADIPHRLPDAFARAVQQATIPRHTALAVYQNGKQELTAWLRRHFEDLISSIKSRKSVQLTVLQSLWMGLIVGMEFGTGGGFLLVEGVLDIVMFPLISPLLLKALSWDHYKLLVREAGQKHQRLCLQVLDDQYQAYDELLQGLGSTRADPEGLEDLVAEIEAALVKQGWM
ncbi:GTPase domain-containing protein [bacterium]|nr:GTPase domain-containing protein [candidate division CSSED10-310 bacterium]